MKTHIHEDDARAVSLHVEYDLVRSQVVFHSVRVLDVNYEPCGPDLTKFLHECVLLGPPEAGSQAPSGERYLSKISEEILNS